MEAKIQTAGNLPHLSELRQALNQASNPLREERTLLLLRSIDELGRQQQEAYEQTLTNFRAKVARGGIISRMLLRAPKDPNGVIPCEALREGISASGVKDIFARIWKLADVGIVRVVWEFDDMMTAARVSGVSITELGRNLMDAASQPERLPLDSSWRNPLLE